MPTDLEARKSLSKNEALLQRQFAELSARMRRIDVLGRLLLLMLVLCSYALLMGLLDRYDVLAARAGMRVIFWICYASFVGLISFLLVRMMKSAFRRINPYYVAQQLEQTLPDAKNRLINWLDLHEQEMPAAFRKNLSSTAVEHFEDSEPEQTLSTRKNWLMLGALGLPTLGLIFLFLLGPMAFLSSMLRALLPWIDTPMSASTHITLLQPDGAAEVSPAQPVLFTARIEGRVPDTSRQDAPRLLYRYQIDEEYRKQPLQMEGEGIWSAQLPAEQLHNGLTYRISAGAAITPEYPVRIRARAHVKKFIITYLHRPYKKLANARQVFPNQASSVPVIHGPRGTEVELALHASRPVQQARVELISGKEIKQLPVRKAVDDPSTFVCRWMLEQPAKFRVAFTSIDGEENADRSTYEISMFDDELPSVVISQPGTDVKVAENGTLHLEGRASNQFGLQALSLQLHIASGPDRSKLQARRYLEGKSFLFDDGTYPSVIEYKDFLALDQLKNDQGTIVLLPPGTVLEYWLEATDSADYPNPKGNIGKSSVYRITLLTAIKNPQQQQAERHKAEDQQRQHVKQHDEQMAKENKERQQKAKEANSQNPGDDKKKRDGELEQQKQKIDKAFQEDATPQHGNSKSGEPQNPGENKAGPQPDSESPPPQQKDQAPMSPGDAGNNKEQGEEKGSSGESKDGGKGKGKDGSKEESKGERKDGPGDAMDSAKDQGAGKKVPAGGGKEEGPMKMNPAEAPSSKENTSGEGAPMPLSKQERGDPKTNDSSPAQGSVKGVEPNGPEPVNKDPQSSPNPLPEPESRAKPGGKNSPEIKEAEAKAIPNEQGPAAGQARGDATDHPKDPSWNHMARMIEQLSGHDEAGKVAGKELADIARQAQDERKRELAKEALDKNQRDPKSGEPLQSKNPSPSTSKEDLTEKKGMNPFGSHGQSQGVTDEVKLAIANKEFARRIAQMQLNDWKKRLTPERLRHAGLSEVEWQRFVKNMQAYDAQVRQWNARMAQTGRLRGDPRTPGSQGMNPLTSTSTGDDTLEGGLALPPPDLLDAQRRFLNPKTRP